MASASVSARNPIEHVILFSMTKEAFQGLPSDVQSELSDLCVEEDHRSDTSVVFTVPAIMRKEACVVAESIRQCNTKFCMWGVSKEVAS